MTIGPNFEVKIGPVTTAIEYNMLPRRGRKFFQNAQNYTEWIILILS